jgi:hypothetical protein
VSEPGAATQNHASAGADQTAPREADRAHHHRSVHRPVQRAATVPTGRGDRRRGLGQHRSRRRDRRRHRQGHRPVHRHCTSVRAARARHPPDRRGRPRGGDRALRRPGRRRAARRRSHRRGDQPQPAGELAQPLPDQRQQGRPVRRLRSGRHPAHRPCPAPAADPRHPGHGGAAFRGPRPQGPARPPDRAGQPAPRASGVLLPRPGRAVHPPRRPDQPAVPGPVHLPGRRRLGSPRPGSRPGCAAPATPAAPTRPSCTPT